MKNFLIAFSYCLLFVKSYGQLSQNVNLTYGSSISGVTFGTNSADWIYGLKGLANGETIVTGYSHPSGVGYTHPSAMLVDPSGAKIWEESYTCLYGIGFDVYELPQGFVIIGRGESVAGCSNPSSMFSILVSKTTGLIIPSWGVKYYNDQSIALPPAQNGLSTTNVNENNNGKPRSCEIRNSSNQITGFMICGNYNDNSYPTNANSLPHFTTGCFLLKIDALGRPDPSFGSGGIKTYYQNTISKYLNPHLYNVCVNYDGSGNPQGFVAVGDINENITVLPSPNGSFNRDALLFMTDMSGNITYYDVYDENSHQKWGSALSYPYADNPDNPLCTQMGAYPVQENSNEKATRVRQKVNGGPLIVLNQFDYTFYSVSSCVSTYPNNAFFIASDPSVMEIDLTGVIVWTQNVFQSSGRDYENDLIVDAGGGGILVLGMTNMEPNPGTPTSMQAVVSKLDYSGTIIYEYVYSDNVSGQVRICPFDFDLNNNGALLLVGIMI